MPDITIKDFKIPNTCGECNFIGHYESGPFAHNPHCCCELIWRLRNEDYKVNKNALDSECPLKTIHKMFDDYEYDAEKITNFDRIKRKILKMDISEFIEYCGGETCENIICKEITNDHMHCKNGNPNNCGTCIKEYLEHASE